MKKFFFIILIPLILFSSTSYSKTMYVTDILYIMARRQPGLDFKIVDQLSSNERVNLLRSEESWAQISFKDNKTGWVLKRFLTEETPKTIQISELKETENAQAEKIAALEKKNITLKQSKAEMAELMSSLKIENQNLKEAPYRIMLLLAGVGIFLLGCIMTLILQRTGQKRRSRLSF
ncbi:MAG: TIGR04211 family SH3 domain-containing protein [Deltaproteobacteria bacterium]|nr:TIGR04211 family SH3 domain-containing protein [Deltaproteobacteria bacterium]